METQMQKQKLKRFRKQFNDTCLKRDGGKCVLCAKPASVVHHICDRHEMPNNGYATENGVSLCDDCHKKAEQFHAKRSTWAIHPDELYKKINSSEQIARIACLMLK